MGTIYVQSPTRVDLAGGTLDCWPLFAFLGQCTTINVAIDIYTYVELTPGKDKVIRVEIQDLNFVGEYDNLDSFMADPAAELQLLKSHVGYWRPKLGFHLKTKSDSPVGGGLGGSSSLSISLLKAFGKWLGQDMTVASMVNLASNLEAQVLNALTGTQDYYPPLIGGLNLIHYSMAGVQYRQIPTPVDLFSRQFLLVYTGKPHHSGMNNWEIIKAAVEGDQKVVARLRRLREISSTMESACLGNRWTKLPELLRQEYDARIQLAPAVSCPEIERLHALSIQSGALAVKVCGAGGGGCVIVWTGESNREKVREQCQAEGFKVLAAQPVKQITPS